MEIVSETWPSSKRSLELILIHSDEELADLNRLSEFNNIFPPFFSRWLAEMTFGDYPEMT
jgi:hypothetical protein